MSIPRPGRRQQLQQRHGLWRNPNRRVFTSRRSFCLLLTCLAVIAILPPIFFHFKLKRFHQTQLRQCSWLNGPPLVCAHGGDSTNAFPNTMAAYHAALHSQVDCIEIDVSRSSDGVLFALHDRDLQRISGNTTTKVGYMSVKEIEDLDANRFPLEFHNQSISTVEDALKLISSSVRRVILDAKVGPPLYGKDLAKDILSVVQRAQCKNCIIWAKSDNLVRDVMKLSPDVTVGYIVMREHSRARGSLLRMRGASVVGVYHELIDDKLLRILKGRKKKVYAWTVDDEVSMKKMLYDHVDAVVTSNPTLFRRLMQDIRTQCLQEGFSFKP
ncbi:glycerophosphodiester phosphodiesterase GDPD4 isoform X1 [Diospyros lotus]|uniref:glycerophosphodiester phosphodiesterase GDPD4 isoform X1 n=1 Tax=Diospyros lotus TaxID=55363 RepID=UPI00225165F3|nr:glycerophosphodiester phosphodiesterase GDPD4 isoform X1 [Diospyros lotus]